MRRLWLSVLLGSLLVSASAGVSTPAAYAEEGASNTGGSEVRLSTRSGLTGGFVSSSPNFYGGGAILEGALRFDDRYAVGVRLDGLAMFGTNLGDEVAAGIRVIAGTLLKGEYLVTPGTVNPVLGLGIGRYAVAVTGASVGADRKQVGAIAAGGAAFGLAPQIGIDLGSFRLAGLSHLVFVGSRVDPAFAIELSWEAFGVTF